MSLSKLIVEGLSESSLRKMLLTIGVPTEAIADFRTLKLLDCLIRMAQVASATGLALSKDGKRIWDRLDKEETNPPRPVAHLFALYDIRLIKAHKTENAHKKLMEELKRFGVTAGQEAAGYGKILDGIYDALYAQLNEATSKIASGR
jgi:hypothetical protein